jgi:hypothetical protein
VSQPTLFDPGEPPPGPPPDTRPLSVRFTPLVDELENAKSPEEILSIIARMRPLVRGEPPPDENWHLWTGLKERIRCTFNMHSGRDESPEQRAWSADYLPKSVSEFRATLAKFG